MIVILMVNLSEEMKTAFLKVKPFPVATASKDGVPNVVPIEFCWLEDDESVWIGDNFMVKSWQTLKKIPLCNLCLGPETGGCFQIKEKEQIYSSGEKFEKMKANVHASKPGLSAKSLIEVKILGFSGMLQGLKQGKNCFNKLTNFQVVFKYLNEI